MTEQNNSWRDDIAGLSFEEAYHRLDETVTRLERGELSLSESELLYYQGMELAQRCQQLLAETELRITQIDNQDIPVPPVGSPGDDSGGWDLPPPLEPDDPSLFDDSDLPF